MRRQRALLPLLAVAAVLLSACSEDTPTKFAYDDERVKTYFIDECNEAGGSGLDKNYCGCVWDGFQAQSISADDVRKFEDEQAKASSDADIVIPENIKRVMDNCRRDPSAKGGVPSVGPEPDAESGASGN